MRGPAGQVVDRAREERAGAPRRRRLSKAISAQRPLTADRGNSEAVAMTRPRPIPWQRRLAHLALGCGVAPALLACGGTLDAGSDRDLEQLPVNAQNPLILSNDGVNDNWHGEYALLLARGNGNNLAGIIVSTGGAWSDLDANVSGWQELVARARESGLLNPPDPVRSPSQPLRRPGDGAVESTQANDSEGARFIVRTSAELAEPG